VGPISALKLVIDEDALLKKLKSLEATNNQKYEMQ
jgi:hypothetical protein